MAVLVGLVEDLKQRGRTRPARSAGGVGELELGIDVSNVCACLGIMGAGDHAHRGRNALLGVAGEFFAFFGRRLPLWAGAGSISMRRP